MYASARAVVGWFKTVPVRIHASLERQAINEEVHCRTIEKSSSSDGEGYDLYISCLEGETENNPRWEAIKLPYHDKETYVPDEENELDPFQLLKSYKDLLKR